MYILQSELKIWYFLQIAKNLRFKAVTVGISFLSARKSAENV